MVLFASGSRARLENLTGGGTRSKRTVQFVLEPRSVGKHGPLLALAGEDEVERKAEPEPGQVGQDAVEGSQGGAGRGRQLPGMTDGHSSERVAASSVQTSAP